MRATRVLFWLAAAVIIAFAAFRLGPLHGRTRQKDTALDAQNARWLRSLESRNAGEQSKALRDVLRHDPDELSDDVLMAVVQRQTVIFDAAARQNAQPALQTLTGVWFYRRLMRYFQTAAPQDELDNALGPGMLPVTFGFWPKLPPDKQRHLAEAMTQFLRKCAPGQRLPVVKAASHLDAPFRAPVYAAALQSDDAAVRAAVLEHFRYSGRIVPSPFGPKVAGRPALLPDLISLLRRGGTWEKQQAADALAAMGPTALPAIPALCEGLAWDGGPQTNNIVERKALAEAVRAIADGPDAAANLLRENLHDKDARVRRSAAIALGRTDDFTGERFVKNAAGQYVQKDEDIALTVGFVLAVPALAAACADPDAAVRVEAAKSLASQARQTQYQSWRAMLPQIEPNFPVSLWMTALPDLSRALNAGDLPVRQSVSRALADIVPALRDAVPALRGALHDTEQTVRDNAVLALSHIAKADKAIVADPLLRDLASSAPESRRRAAEELRLTAAMLWEIDRYGIPPWGRPAPMAPSVKSFQDVLLARLTSALSDPDPKTRAGLAEAIEQIARVTLQSLGKMGGQADLKVIAAALERARKAVAGDNPALANRLAALKRTLTGPLADRAAGGLLNE